MTDGEDPPGDDGRDDDGSEDDQTYFPNGLEGMKMVLQVVDIMVRLLGM